MVKLKSLVRYNYYCTAEVPDVGNDNKYYEHWGELYFLLL